MVTGLLRRAPSGLACHRLRRGIVDWAEQARQRLQGGAPLTDDLTNPVAIAYKVQGLVEQTNAKLESAARIEPSRARDALIVLMAQLSAFKQSGSGGERDRRFVGEPPARAELESLAHYWNFAEIAYEEHVELRKRLGALGYTLVRHDTTTDAGRVGHYVAFSPAERVAVVALKGTSSVSDVVTDCLGQAVPVELAAPPAPGVRMHAHEGMLAAADTLADDTVDLVEHLFVPSGYRIVVCGHSLGAGTASIFGTLLRSRITPLQQPGALHVHAFACPPVFDYDSALACAPCVPLPPMPPALLAPLSPRPCPCAAVADVTSVVNNTDIIPRASVANLEVMIHVLHRYDERLREAGVDVGDKLSLAKLAVMGPDALAGLISPDELHTIVAAAQADTALRDASHMFVPGRCVLLHEREAADAPGGAVGAVVGDATHPQLRLIEIDEKLLLDHLGSAYGPNFVKALEGLQS